jgi:hypothetical protein
MASSAAVIVSLASPQTLTITSAGRDKDTGTPADNIELTIKDTVWKVSQMTVKGTVVNSGIAEVSANVRLYCRSPDIMVTAAVDVPLQESKPFALPETDICCGPRENYFQNP